MSNESSKSPKIDVGKRLDGILKSASAYTVVGGNKIGTSARPAKVPRPQHGRPEK